MTLDDVEVVVSFGVQPGVCVVLQEGSVLYAGPIAHCPAIHTSVLLMNADDFEALKQQLIASALKVH